MNPWVIALVISLSSAATWQIQGWRYDGRMEVLRHQHSQQIAGIREAAAADLIESTEAARREERAQFNQLAEAERDARKREQAQRAAAAAARAESDGLRSRLNSIEARLPGLSVDALIERATTLGRLFGDCAADYQRMAEKAGRHASDVKTLQDSWPR